MNTLWMKKSMRPLVRQTGHRDVNELRRALADDRRAEQPQILWAEEQLDESVQLADDLAARG